MILRIARKELLDLSRDGRVRVLAVLVLVVSVVSLAAGWKTYSDLSAQHRTAQAATREQWLNQPKKNPHSAAHYGVYAFKPKSPLAIVDTGIDPYVGVAVWLEAHKQNEMKYRPAQDRTAAQRFGELGGAEVLQVILPLFIVLMAFPVFAGEREQGTLRQLLSVGARPRDLALGKALGVAAGLGIILVPATLLGVIALTLSTSQGLLADDPLRVVRSAASTCCTSRCSSRCRCGCRRGPGRRDWRWSCCSRSGSPTAWSRRGWPRTWRRGCIRHRRRSSSRRRWRPS